MLPKHTRSARTVRVPRERRNGQVKDRIMLKIHSDSEYLVLNTYSRTQGLSHSFYYKEY